MNATDRRVLRALQALVLALPLFLGGRHPLGVSLGLATVVALLLWTLRARARNEANPEAPGVGILAAFLALALATTLPLPPALLGLLSPDTAALYRDMLPGWPGAGGWSAWRPLAFDAHGVWYELCKIGIALGAFVVLVAYPWRAELDDEQPRLRVFGTLVLTLIAGGAGLAAVALVHDATGSDRVLGFLDETIPGRASGPFVNPNHFAAWLEMVIPLGVAYLGAVAVRLGRRIARMAAASRTMGVQPRRAWASALAASQRGLWLPLLLTGGVLLMLVAHRATGSRGGTMSLLVGLAVVGIGFARPTRGRPVSPLARWIGRAAVAALVVLSLASVASWARLEEEIEAGGAVEGGDVSLLTRISVSAKGRGIVADFPVFGTGLGSWLHAFQLYQAPPVEGGIWQHAHNDYLELAAETGLAGVALAAWFAFTVAAAARRGPTASPCEHEGRHGERPAGFEVADWRAALASATWLRFGVLGAVAAVLVHSLVDFGLRLPANLLLLFVVLAMLVLSRPPALARDSRAVAAFTALLCLAIAPVLAGRLLEAAGGTPLAPATLLAQADAALAEKGDRERALALVRRALDRSPASRAAHEAMAVAAGGGVESELALERAIRLDAWAIELRDWLAQELWRDGRCDEAAAALEESVARYPYLVSHVYPESLPEPEPAPGDAAAADTRATAWIAELGGGDTLAATLAGLDPQLAGAVERGLRRALDERPGGRARQEVVEGLVLLLEARERFAEAGRELRAAAGITPEDAPRLARAARNFLRANDPAAAEEALVAALRLTPEQGELYRELAVEVFARRGDFATAEEVLRVAQQNSLDMVPVYRGLTKVLSMREAARFDAGAAAPAPGESLAAARRLEALRTSAEEVATP